MPRTRRLILVGGGHVHVEVLRSAARERFADRIILISPEPIQLYSGMMPSQLRGAIAEADLSIDLRELCDRAGARFLEAAATRIDASHASVLINTDSEPVNGDVCSLDIGSIPAGLSVPGVRTHAYGVRPQASWRALTRLVDEFLRTASSAPFSCTIVGGGAAGVELTLALLARAKSARQTIQCTLIAGGDAVLDTFSNSAQTRATALLVDRGAKVRTGTMVAAVAADHILLDDGSRIDSALTIWATGPAAPPILRDSGLPVDGDGFLRVDSTLRAVSGIPVFGAGDCVSQQEAPWVTRSGVYAVRAAPVLANNLRAVMRNPPAEPKLHDPQRNALAILDTSDGKALLYWRGWSHYSALALRLKRWLDERWIERYRM